MPRPVSYQRALIVPVLLAAALTACSPEKQNRGGERRTNAPGGVLLIVLDGVRPDYVTPELMPTLAALSRDGFVAENHVSAFPTLTRVNATSLVTGSYPARHGVIGNRLYLPSVRRDRGLDTSDAGVLMKADRSTGGRLITAPTLGGILRAHGAGLTVFSTGSAGSAFLQNHRIDGGIVTANLILPKPLETAVRATVGAEPKRSERLAWITDALIAHGIPTSEGNVLILWIGEPDHAAHRHGVGSPQTMEALRRSDDAIRRVLKALDESGQRDRVAIVVTSDHGSSTHLEAEPLRDRLVAAGLKKSSRSTDVVVAGSAIYVQAREPDRIRGIVEYLQRQPEVGAIFTAPRSRGDDTGVVEGTLSMALVQADHPTRAPDILISMAWSDAVNEHGYPGASYSASAGAGHGSASRFDIASLLVASGPGIRAGTSSRVPTSVVDIVPTILHLRGLAVPPEMDGRIIHEMLAEPNGSPAIAVESVPVEATSVRPWGTYTVSLERSRIGGHFYVHSASAGRSRD
jgi:arylsulfatase A-like enzyme